MPRHLHVRHVTEYRYSEAVSFDRHRMMFRPRDSHSLRLLATHLSISPEPQRVTWIYDAFGNSVAFAEFGEKEAFLLRFVSEIEILHYETTQATELLLRDAERYPFAYTPDELPDLQPVMMLHRPDEEGRLHSWARQIADASDGSTLSVLTDTMTAIRRDLSYQRRPKAGTQDPACTLQLGTGSCRDFALLMIEALRSLGFAARFVSGYIYSRVREHHKGGGATHAWVQVYLPGCGWIEIDPTNGIFGNRDLIRIAVARDHKQACPLSGSYIGNRASYEGMSVSVTVREHDITTAVENAVRAPSQ